MTEHHQLDPASFDRLQQRLQRAGQYDPKVAKVLSTPAPWDAAPRSLRIVRNALHTQPPGNRGILMQLSNLLSYLLDNRHRFTGTTIVDCIDLAIIVSADPLRRVQLTTLERRWACNSYQAVSFRIGRLRKAGLVDYERGAPGNTGYLFFRIGPVESCRD